ncbi:MAG: phage terminase large subunit family protein, partial [Deltaproteobacteria bacterium]|nr:phage terminase large subunit family protein [Deltaproteobacteria bacterium]
KGRQTVKQRLADTPDQMGEYMFQKYSVKKLPSVDLILISTIRYKNIISDCLRIPRRHEAEIQRAGFSDFPADYGKRYFEMLTAEEKLSDGTWDNRGRRNEAFDVRVYNLAAADYYLDLWVKALRKDYVRNGASQLQAEMEINSVSALENIAAMVGGIITGRKKQG